MVEFTTDQVKQLAPDDASLKAAQKLIKPSSWPLLGFSDNAIWGHCQGSGKNPYQTIIDVNALAFKCSCPSRKFPCKHALALLFLFVSNKDLFTQQAVGSEPEFVTQWLDKREANAKKKEEKAKEQATKVVDPKAQARRLNNRIKKVNTGLESLDLWLKDVIRNGLASVSSQSLNSDVRRIIASLVDCQASGLSNLIAEHTDDLYTSNQAELFYKFTQCFSLVYFISQAFQHLEDYPSDWQEEIKLAIGFSKTKEEVAKQDPVVDDFLLLYRTTDIVRNLDRQLFVFWGINTKKFYYQLNFIPRNAPVALGLTYVSGHVYSGKAYVYPGVGEYRRVIFDDQMVESQEAEYLSQHGSVDFSSFGAPDLLSGLVKYKDLLKANPLLHHATIMVNSVVFANYALNQYYRQSLAVLKNKLSQNQQVLEKHQQNQTTLSPEQDQAWQALQSQNAKELKQKLEFEKSDVSKRYFNSHASKWYVVDSQGKALEVENDFAQVLYWYDITNGEPFTAIIDLNDQALTVKAIYFQGKLLAKS